MVVGLIDYSVVSTLLVNPIFDTTNAVYETALKIGGLVMLHCIDISTVAVIICWFGDGLKYFYLVLFT